MAIGIKGADLAGKAVGEAFGAIFGGDEKASEARMEAEGKKIEADAMKLCAQLPPMLATQQQLAAALPAFKPYATMTQEDIDDCGKDDHDDATRAQIATRCAPRSARPSEACAAARRRRTRSDEAKTDATTSR